MASGGHLKHQEWRECGAVIPDNTTTSPLLRGKIKTASVCELGARCTEGTEGLVFNRFTHNRFVFLLFAPSVLLISLYLRIKPSTLGKKNLLSRVSETFRGYLSLGSSGAESCCVFIDEDRRLRREKQRRLLSFSFAPVRCDDITFLFPLSGKVLSREALSYYNLNKHWKWKKNNKVCLHRSGRHLKLYNCVRRFESADKKYFKKEQLNHNLSKYYFKSSVLKKFSNFIFHPAL